MTPWRGESFAKINRELRVGGLRPDGFHDLLSRFSSIDLADRMAVEPADTLELVCEGLAVPSGDGNLVVQAARALASELRIEPRARIRLEKKIPVGAGLGGGSSNAAEALVLLRALWAPDLPNETLASIAPRLGSDVLYFLTGGEADVAGRGERVLARDDAESVDLLLLFPPFQASTRAVFDEFSRQTSGRKRLPPTLEIERSGKFFGPNELALPLLVIQPAMKAYLESASEAALEFGVSGSGSTVVLLGAKPGAAASLAQRHPEASVQRTRTLGREEYRSRTSSPPGGSQWTSRR